MTLPATLARRFARLATNAVVRWPALWRLLRMPLERQFDWLAPRWDAIRSPGHLAALEAALAALDSEPRSALDVGTGTGDAAFALARRFPRTDVVGVDLSAGLVEQARQKLPAELRERVRFEQADSAGLPYADGAFDLAALANMIPFFDELERVLAVGGSLVVAFSNGPQTPIYVPPERLRTELARRGFTYFEDFAAGGGTALLARKHGAS
jgi:ubiquinone/menaquinone biosynthesis C-methylase UbiE